MKKTHTDISCEVFKRFVNGESYASIAKDLDIPPGRASSIGNDMVYFLAPRKNEAELMRIYPQLTYAHAYHSFSRDNQKFYATCLKARDLREKREYWIKLIDDYAARHGSVDRPLTPEDSLRRLGLDVRTTNCLISYGLSTIAEVIALVTDAKEQRRVVNFGQTMLRHTLEILQQHSFVMVEPEKVTDIMAMAVEMLRYPKSYLASDREKVAAKLQEHLANWGK